MLLSSRSQTEIKTGTQTVTSKVSNSNGLDEKVETKVPVSETRTYQVERYQVVLLEDPQTAGS